MATEEPIGSEMVGRASSEREVPLEERLRRHIQEHVGNEREALREYQDLADSLDGGAIRYLIGMIIEDERRHHQWMSDLAETLTADLEWGRHPGGVPHVEESMEAPGVLATTERMLEMEREDLRELAQLEKDMAGMGERTIWLALVEAMTADTRKHIRLLETIRGLAAPSR